jgi:hypothetical protein
MASNDSFIVKSEWERQSKKAFMAEFKALSRNFHSWRSQKISVGMVYVPGEIRTRHFPNTSHVRYSGIRRATCFATQ